MEISFWTQQKTECGMRLYQLLLGNKFQWPDPEKAEAPTKMWEEDIAGRSAKQICGPHGASMTKVGNWSKQGSPDTSHSSLRATRLR